LKSTTTTTIRGTSRPRSVTTIRPRSETTQERQAREAELAAAKAALQQMQESLNDASQRFEEAKRQREEAQSEIKKVIAERRPALQAARQKRQELAARARAADETLLNPERLKMRMTALDTYLPFDPVAERNRLLATLKSPGRK
jgi:chromosome segregation ATPase